MAEWRIDAGCGDGRFCPSEPISRAEMAAWLYRAAALLGGAHPPPAKIEAVPGFSDDPDGAVTRAEAAVMLVAAFGHLAATDRVQGVFADTADTPAAGAIEGIHAAGLIKGCATEPLRYCPHQPITRGQMSTMLARAIQRAEPTVGLIVNEPEADRGYMLINTRNSDEVFLIDHLGGKVHTWRLEGSSVYIAKLLENGNLMVFHSRPGRDSWITEVDWASNIVWEYPAAGVHHDFLILPNGNLLFLMGGIMTRQEIITTGAEQVPRGEWIYDYLREVKPTGPNSGEIVWEWSTLDHLVQDHDPSKSNYGPIAERPGRIDINYSLHQIRSDFWDHDWTHINAIDYNPVLDQIMLSVRNFSELWIIDRNTTTEEAAGPKGDLLYRWGNPRAYGAGDYQDQQLFWQHYTHWIPPGLPGAGNVLIFNNGNEYAGLQRNYSSVDEITLPAFEHNAYPRDHSEYAFTPARPQWIHTTSTYDPYASSAQRLPNGNTLICSDGSVVTQVTPNGKTVWQYVNPVPASGPPAYQGDHAQNVVTYRTPWYPPDYPGLKGMDLTPTGPLEYYR